MESKKRNSTGTGLIILVLVLFVFTGIMLVYTFKPSAPAQTASDPLPRTLYSENKEYDGRGIVWTATPNSSCFSYVGYDGRENILAVIFRSNESRAYLYRDFSSADYAEFVSADSLGKYYNACIKGYYDCERIDNIKGTFYEP